MATDFSRTLSLLRQEKGISQRKAAAELGISQALLSHYENGIREPGLSFVVKVCSYYHVSADYLLGRTLSRDGAIIDAEELYDSSAEKGRFEFMETHMRKIFHGNTGKLDDLLPFLMKIIKRNSFTLFHRYTKMKTSTFSTKTTSTTLKPLCIAQ